MVLAATACTPPRNDDLAFEDAADEDVKEDRADRLPLELPEIRSVTRFKSISFPDGGLLVLGRSVKFLIDNRNPAKPVVHFMNSQFPNGGEAARFHYDFAQAILDVDMDVAQFNNKTYFTENKAFYAGTIQQYKVEDETLYGLQLYPQDVAREESLLVAARAVSKVFSIRGARLALVTTGPQQTTNRITADLAALKMERLTVDAILGRTNYLPMQLGEAWGYLRVFPKADALLEPTDIPVFDELPLDLTVVAGVVTRAVQDSSSHINLKSKERGTPDMVLRDASPTNPLLKPFLDKPVHLVVKGDGFTITATTAAMVKKKADERAARPWQTLPLERETRLLRTVDMCPRDPADCLALSRRYGSKASNLGFLINKNVLGRTVNAGSLSARFGYDIVPGGLGVPMTGYRDFVAANPALAAKVDALAADEKAGKLTPQTRRDRIAEVQGLFMTAAFPPGVLAALQTEVVAMLPADVKRMKVRSSANAEDIPNFDGAGLYTSFTADLTKVDAADGACRVKVQDDGDLEVRPETVACAVKGVYASLWNQRAVDERTFARIDHASAAMGLAIVPRYDSESDVVANSVVVTRAVNASGVIGYTLSTQAGNALVTNPPPGTAAEQIIAVFATLEETPAYVVTRFATPAAGAPALTQKILGDDQLHQLLEITATAEMAYCRAKPTYYPGGDCDFVLSDGTKPRALDLELKLLENGQFVCKQVREFSGR